MKRVTGRPAALLAALVGLLWLATPAQASGTHPAATGTPTLPVSATAASGPVLSVTGRACPGATVRITGTGFAAGSYQLHTDAGTLGSSQVTVTNGSLPATSLRVPLQPPAHTTLSVTDVATGTTQASYQLQRGTPQLSQGILDSWDSVNSWDCFAPSERIDLSYPTASTSGPTSLVTDPAGKFVLHLNFHPSTDWTQGQVQFTGEVSGQQNNWRLTPVDGTTLASGQQIGGAVPPNELASPTLGYAFEPSVQIWKFNADGTSTVVWAAARPVPFQPADRMVMQADGNLVVIDGSGHLLWASGTAGTGTGNHVTMQQDGNLVMRTGAGVAVWSTNTGLVRNARGLVSYAYLASSRAGAAVYVNGLIKQATSAAQLIRGAGRTVYLQRYLNGHWQNMLARTADSQGQLAVGFIQTRVFQYRLVLLPTASAAGATSGSTFR